MSIKPRSLFPDDNAIRLMAETKQAEADALPPGPEKRKLQKEANSLRILSEAKAGLPESYSRRVLSAERSGPNRYHLYCKRACGCGQSSRRNLDFKRIATFTPRAEPSAR
jgi:hypothetical protein